MINGHGDDIYVYGNIRSNFSSNVYYGADHSDLNEYLCGRLACVRSYPEPEPCSLEREWAARFGIGAENVCVTNGATEAIYLVAQVYRGSRSLVWMPTFSEYADACRLHDHRVKSVYTLNRLPDEPSLVWLCNPNNPTGEVREAAFLRMTIEAYPQHLFIIDQSYEAFTDKEVLSAGECVSYPNVLLLHSMTKRFAIPGLRLGGVTGHRSLTDRLRKHRMPWSVNSLAIVAGHYLLRHIHSYALDVKALMNERRRVADALGCVGGMEVWPSDTHYMLVRLRNGKASALKRYLAEEEGILIRDASNFEGLDERFFRIAVQAREENDRLVNSVRRWMEMF